MSAMLVDIADCVLTDYAAGFGLSRLSQAITAKRGYTPEFVPGEQSYGIYQVYVAHDKEEGKRLSRNSVSYEYTIEVGVCCRFRDGANATVDPAMQLIQEMGDFFFDYGLSNGKATWIRNEVYFWGDKERLKFDGAFFALWDLVFEGVRSKP